MSRITQEELNYLIDMVESDNKRDWNKATVDLNSESHPDTLKKSFSCGKYCGYEVAKFYQEIIENGLEDEEIIRLEGLKDELYKERVKLQDANREKRKSLRELSRIEILQEYIDLKIKEHEPVEFKTNKLNCKTGNEASLLVSDLHCGMKVDSVFNYYDVEVMKERIEELTSKTILYCKQNNVNKLNVSILGDLISGLIHFSLLSQSEEDVIDQIFIVSDILTEMLIELRKEIPEIIVRSVIGNHGRAFQNKSSGANKTNFERLIPNYIKKSLKNIDIKVISNGDEDFIPYKLNNGKLIVLTHGTYDNPATANASFSKLLKEDVYEVHMGHLHDYKEVNGSVVNGSVIASDDYAITLRKNSPAVQVLKVYLEDDVATYKLNLK